MTKIYIIRHTQTVGNIEKRLTGREDYEITEDGKDYIKKLENALKDVCFDIAYCSTSGRTKKTIQGLADQNNISIIEDENLCEMYFGIYDGWKWEDVNKVNPRIRQMQIETNEIMGIENQETTEEVAQRMRKEITDIANKNKGRNILICSHGVAIEAFLRTITNEKFCERRTEHSQKNTSINIVNFDEEKQEYTIELLNSIKHLDEMER